MSGIFNSAIFNNNVFNTGVLVQEHFSGGYKTKFDYWPKRKFPTKEELKKQRQRLGILPEDEVIQIIVDAVAERQAKDLDLEEDQKVEELAQELEVNGIALQTKYVEMLSIQRERLISQEIMAYYEKSRQVEELEMLTLIASLV